MIRLHNSLRLWSLALLCLWATSQQAAAQCTCKTAPINLNLNANGSKAVSVSDIVTNPMTCAGTLTLSLGNQTIAGNIVTCALANQPITATVTNGANSCTSTVILNDVTPPVINVSDITLACNALNNTLATADDACQGTIPSSQISYTDVVTNGTCADNFVSKTNRTWTATDNKGNTTTKIQVITIERPDLNLVVFPPNTPTFDCSFPLDPNNIAFLGQPTYKGLPVLGNNCMMAVSKTDMTFTVCQKGYKILRTWKVTGFMCMNQTVTGLQEIKVMDNTAPVLKMPKDTTYSTNPKVCTATVNLPKATATDNCSNVTIEAFSAFGTGYGPFTNVATGSYTVTYKATDECGNVSTSNLKVLVKDLILPTPLCHHGLSSSLANMNGGMVTIDAAFFDAGSSDNCTVKAELDFKLKAVNQPTPPAKDVTFTCADQGLQEIQLWVTDKAGNSTYCSTYVDIQDNQQLCATGSKVAIAGEIKKISGEKVQDVNLKMTGYVPLKPIFTSASGLFNMVGLPSGKNYTMQPEKDSLQMNGVSTLDIVLIQKQVLGVKPFTTPQQFIAGDVDKNGKVSTADIVALRKMILGLNKTFPNGNKSWRFVDASYKFKDTLNPLNDVFPETKQFINLKANAKADFLAVKIGDVNGDAKTTSAPSSASRNDNEPLVLEIQDQKVDEGSSVVMKINAPNFQSINALQLKLGFDKNAILLENVEKGSIEDLTEQHFSTAETSEGKLALSWNTVTDAKNFADETLFILTFKAKQNGKLSDWFFLEKNGDLQAEAYDESEAIRPLSLHFKGEKVHNDFMVLQNQPNPFHSSTEIQFRLPVADEVRFTLYDLSGKVIQSETRHFAEGWNTLTLPKNALPNSGIYYYRLDSNNGSATKKMIMID
jgi:Secretion system C-terminal sorting domain